MRLLDLPRTTGFRLAARFMLLFGTASLILFGLLFWQTNRYLVSRTDAWLWREQASVLRRDGDEALRLLTSRAQFGTDAERPFALFTISGERIVGSDILYPAGSPPLDVPFEFWSGSCERYRGILHRMSADEVFWSAKALRICMSLTRSSSVPCCGAAV